MFFFYLEKVFFLEAETEGEKLQWMVLMHYARRDRIQQIKEGNPTSNADTKQVCKISLTFANMYLWEFK